MFKTTTRKVIVAIATFLIAIFGGTQLLGSAQSTTITLAGTSDNAIQMPKFPVDAANTTTAGFAKGGLFQQQFNTERFETFTMDVTYSRTWFALYWPSVLLGLLIIAAIIVGIVFAVRKLKLSLAKLKTNLKTNEDKTHTGLISFLGGLFVSLGIIILWVIWILWIIWIWWNYLIC